MKRGTLVGLVVAMVVLALASPALAALPSTTVTYDVYTAGTSLAPPVQPPYAYLSITWQQNPDPAYTTGPTAGVYDSTAGTITWTVPQNCQVKVVCQATGLNSVLSVGTSAVLVNTAIPVSAPATAPAWASLMVPYTGGSGNLDLGTHGLFASAFRLTTAPAAGYLLTSDATGNGTWQAPPSTGVPYTGATSNVDLGTHGLFAAAFRLTTSPAPGYVLTSDASGNASWQAASSGALPAGSASELQYRSSATALGAAAGSAVDATTGAVTLTSQSTTSTPLTVLPASGATAPSVIVGGASGQTSIIGIKYPGAIAVLPPLINMTFGNSTSSSYPSTAWFSDRVISFGRCWVDNSGDLDAETLYLIGNGLNFNLSSDSSGSWSPAANVPGHMGEGIQDQASHYGMDWVFRPNVQAAIQALPDPTQRGMNLIFGSNGFRWTDMADPGATGSVCVASLYRLGNGLLGVGDGGANSNGSLALKALTASGAVTGATVRLHAYTVATLPTGVAGDTAYVTDATAPSYLATVVGGGAVVCPVFYNGSAWVCH